MRPSTLFASVLALMVSLPAPAQTAYPRTRRNSSYGVNTTGDHRALAGTFHGTLKSLTSKEIVLQNDDDQTVVIRRSRKTKFLMDDKEIKSSAIAMNSLVTVEANEDIDLKPIAVSLSVDIPKLDKDDSEEKPKQ